MESKGFKIFSQIVIPLVLAGLGFLGGWYLMQRDKAMQYFEYYVVKSDNAMSGIQTDIKINEMPTKDFSIVTVKVFNTSESDFRDVLLTFRLLIDQPVIYGYDVRNKYNVKLTNQSSGKANEASFPIAIANRNSDSPIATAHFIVEGLTAPDCVLEIDHIGLSVRQISTPKEKSARLFFIIMMVGGITLILGGVSIMVRTIERKNKITPYSEIGPSSDMNALFKENKTEYYEFLATWLEAAKKKELMNRKGDAE
jgi:hypothetical protein